MVVRRRRDGGRALALGLARVRVVLADVRGHRWLRSGPAGRRDEARVSHRAPGDGLHQTAGWPSLRGSVAAASEPSGAAGPPADELDRVLLAEAAVERPGRSSGDGPARRAPPRRRRVARLEPDVDRWREGCRRFDEPARRGDRGPDVDAAVDDGRHELGVDLRLRVAAHRPDDDPRTEPDRSGTASRASACGAVRLPGARTLAWSGSRLKALPRL